MTIRPSLRAAAFFAALASGTTLTASASAQNVVALEFLMGQPLQYMKDGKVNGCGVRLVGLGPSVPKSKEVPGFDVSVNVYAQGIGMVKGIGMTAQLPGPESTGPRSRNIRLDNIWIKPPGQSATTPRDGSPQRGTDPPESILYVTADMTQALDAMNAIFANKVIIVGLRNQGANFDRMYSGQVELDANTRGTFANCMVELEGALRAALPVPNERPKQ